MYFNKKTQVNKKKNSNTKFNQKENQKNSVQLKKVKYTSTKKITV